MSTCRFERMSHLARVIPSALKDVILKVSMFGPRGYPFITQVGSVVHGVAISRNQGRHVKPCYLSPLHRSRSPRMQRDSPSLDNPLAR